MRIAVKNSCLSLAKRQLANADFDLAAESFNHAGVIVSNIENIIRLFFCLSEAAFKIHLAQKSERARATHFEWAWRLCVCIYLCIYNIYYRSIFTTGVHCDKKSAHGQCKEADFQKIEYLLD